MVYVECENFVKGDAHFKQECIAQRSRGAMGRRKTCPYRRGARHCPYGKGESQAGASSEVDGWWYLILHYDIAAQLKKGVQAMALERTAHPYIVRDSTIYGGEPIVEG